MKYSKSTNAFFIEGFHTEIPDDAVDISDATHAALLEAQSTGKRITSDDRGNPVAVDPPEQTPEQRQASIVSAVQVHMDGVARSMGYDDMRTAITYAEEPAVKKFQTEGRALRAWRSKVWAYCYDVLDQVKARKREEPGIEQLISELPQLA